LACFKFRFVSSPPKDEIGPRPRTSTNPSAVLIKHHGNAGNDQRGACGAFNDRNTALVTALKIIGAIDTAYSRK
jgi:hypothetical protein